MGQGKKPDVASTIELSFFSESDNIVLNTGVALKLLYPMWHGCDFSKNDENERKWTDRA